MATGNGSPESVLELPLSKLKHMNGLAMDCGLYILSLLKNWLWMSVCLSVCLAFCLSACLSVFRSVCVSGFTVNVLAKRTIYFRGTY